MGKVMTVVAAIVVTAALAAAPRGVLAVGGESDDAVAPVDAVLLEKATQEIDAGNFRAAISDLQKIVRDDTSNANAYNWLGFSHRKLGEYDRALGYYKKALAIDSDHKGANEYLGELYLQIGDLRRAEGRLAKLAELCPSGCEEYEELQELVAAFKKKPRS